MIETGDLGEIKRVKVELKGELDYSPDSEYFRGIAEKFLRYAGVEVVDEGYDAVLRVYITLEIYEDDEEVSGKISFISDVVRFSAQFRSETFITAMTELILKIFGIQPLKKVLKRESRELRAGVARALGEIGDARAVEALIEALKDEDRGVRERSIDALVKIAKKDLGVVDKLIKALKDEDSDVRRGIAEVLDKIGLEPRNYEERILYYIAKQNWYECVEMGSFAVEFLIERLKDKDSYVRENVAWALGEIGDSRAVDALIEALKDEDSDVRSSVAEALGELGWKPRNDKERVLYYIAKGDWYECVKMGSFAVKFLIERLKDEDSYVRKRVAWALGEIGDTRAMDALIKALKDEDSDIRENVAWALGKIGDSRAVDALIEALRDEDKYVRSSVAEALGEIGWEPGSDKERVLYYIAKWDWDKCVKMGGVAVEFLIERLKDKDSYVRERVAWALGEIGWRPRNDEERVLYYIAKGDWDECVKMGSFAVEFLIERLKDEDRDILWENIDVRKNLIDALVKIAKKDLGVVDKLIRALKDEDSYVRSSVAWALGEIGDTRAVDALIEALKDEDSDVRENVAWALGKIGDSRAVEALIEALKDESSYVREKSIDALVKIAKKDLGVVDKLIKALKDEDSDVRKSVAWALGEIGDSRAVDALIEALRDEDSVIRIIVAEALGKIGDARALEALIEALKDEDSDVRKSVACALGKMGDSRAVEALIEALKDESSYVREKSIDALVKIAKKDLGVVDKLIKALKDEDSDVRGGIAEVLGNLGWEPKSEEERVLYYIAKRYWGSCVEIGSFAVEFLIERLKDKDSYVRRSVAEALGEIGDARAVDALIEALKDEDSVIRIRVAEALGKIGDKKAVDALIEALKDQNRYVRESIIKALGKIGDAKAIDTLIRMLKGVENEVGELVKNAIIEIAKKDLVAIDKLVKALKDNDSEIRKKVARTLGEIGDKRAVDSLIEALRDSEGIVRFEARKALVRILRVDFGYDYEKWKWWLNGMKIFEVRGRGEPLPLV
jgi:HEAT repeat protein